MGKVFGMSFNEILAELPTLSVAERQLLVRRAMELDDAMSDQDEELVESRLAAHRADPSSALSFEQITENLRSKLAK